MTDGQKWLLILDFDNTQAPTKHQELQASPALPYSFLLKDMAESGALPLIHCTGRSPVHIIRDIENSQSASLPGPHAARTPMILASVGTEALLWDEEQSLYVPMDRLIKQDAAGFFEEHYETLRAVIENTPGLKLQEDAFLGPHKISGWKDPKTTMSNEELYDALLDTLKVYEINPDDLSITASMQTKFAVDLTPKGATKGNAIRFAAWHYDVPLKNVYYGGDSINDLDGMLVEDINIILPGNAQDSLVQAVEQHIEDKSRIYKAQAPYAQGVFEALVHFGRLEQEPTIPHHLAGLAQWRPQNPAKPPHTLRL
ncbi:MAG: HAD hydrolase family protein [Rhodospirillales bacterium]|nr:HAD hydrolase family protein [Rhodospirillales bacterium]